MRIGARRHGATTRDEPLRGVRRALLLGISVTALTLAGGGARADELGVTPPVILNFYGQVGLVDMPTARFAPDGEISFSGSSTPAQDHYTFGFQALPWLEATFRYSRLDTFTSLDGHNVDLYDRSLGLKFRLMQEGDYWPEIAIGAQDVLGTGAYGAEYLVASKQFGDFDVTGGIGWRRFAGLAPFRNPFTYLFHGFGKRPAREGTGKFLLAQFFHGANAGLFGGVSWRSPVDGLSVLVEASGDRYTEQQKKGAVDIRTPMNLSLVYQPDDTFELNGGYFYGSMWGLMGSVRLNAFDASPEPKLGPEPLPAAERSADDRDDAVLAYLQDKTHFYDSWPGMPRTAGALSAHSEIASALQGSSAYRKLRIESMEAFQGSLLVDIAENPENLSCASVRDFSDAARARGLRQVVFSSQSTPDVRLCAVSAKDEPRIGEPVEVASRGSLEELADADTAPLPAAPMRASEDPLETARKQILDAMAAQALQTYALSLTRERIDIAVDNEHYGTDTQAIGRTLRILMAYAPASVEVFRVVLVTEDEPTNQIVVSRSDLERILDTYGSAYELLPLAAVGPAPMNDPLFDDPLKDYPNFDYIFSPGYRHSLFDPDNPYRYQFYADVGGLADLTRNLNIAGAYEFNLFGNIQGITRASNSQLPHVRSDFAEYYKYGLDGIIYLNANYLTRITDDVYFFGRAGILESMYDGAGGEIYWQPPHSRLALGAEVYAVQQRSFDRLFGLRNYRVVTGHVSLYYDSPFYNLDFAVHAGRYLAGDYGATFQVTRRFANGIEIGAYATLTNVPFSVFGEGSFDKGFIIRIPLGDLVPLHTQEVADLSFTPLTRDGGQRLEGEATLHDLLQRSSEGEMLQTWEKVLYP